MRETDSLCLGKELATGWRHFSKDRHCDCDCFLEGAFGQLEDGGLFEDVVGGGRVQKFQFAGLNESGVSKRGTERLDCRCGGNRWVVGGGQFCRWVGEDSVVEGAGGGWRGDVGILRVQSVAVDELLADDAAVQSRWRVEERIGRGEGLRESVLRVGFEVVGEEAIEFAGFSCG